MHKAELTARHNLQQVLLSNQGEKQIIRMGFSPDSWMRITAPFLTVK
jgi:hypothetical protein